MNFTGIVENMVTESVSALHGNSLSISKKKKKKKYVSKK